MALPEFQRGYVWNRNQVRDLMNSLYSAILWAACWSGSPRPSRPKPRGDDALAAATSS